MSLTPYLRLDVEMDIISVDQLTYDEFVCSMPPHIQNGTFRLNPLNGEISLGLSPEVLNAFLDKADIPGYDFSVKLRDEDINLNIFISKKPSSFL